MWYVRVGECGVYVMYPININSQRSNLDEANFVYRGVQRFDGLGLGGALSRLGLRMRDFEEPPGPVGDHSILQSDDLGTRLRQAINARASESLFWNNETMLYVVSLADIASSPRLILQRAINRAIYSPRAFRKH